MVRIARHGPGALSPRELDEDDVRVRPGRSTRPRSRRRPEHAGATPARVIAVDRGRYTCLTADATEVVAVGARELGHHGIVVGDEVALVGELSGANDTLARIIRVEPRATVLRRSADDTDPVERIVVANADQLGIVTALADPEPRPGLIDRCLVAAVDAGLRPLLVLTKSDLASAADLLAIYRPAAVPAVILGQGDEGRGLAELRRQLAARTTVMFGHSGVGKSTLVNALVPGADRRIGRVNVVTGRGRHTSSSAVALPLPAGGWVIDTPGVRSLGLGHIDRDRLVEAFPDLAPGRAACPGDCDHTDPSTCGLDAWVTGGHAHPERLLSLRRLLTARDPDA